MKHLLNRHIKIIHKHIYQEVTDNTIETLTETIEPETGEGLEKLKLELDTLETVRAWELELQLKKIETNIKNRNTDQIIADSEVKIGTEDQISWTALRNKSGEFTEFKIIIKNNIPNQILPYVSLEIRTLDKKQKPKNDPILQKIIQTSPYKEKIESIRSELQKFIQVPRSVV